MWWMRHTTCHKVASWTSLPRTESIAIWTVTFKTPTKCRNGPTSPATYHGFAQKTWHLKTNGRHAGVPKVTRAVSRRGAKLAEKTQERQQSSAKTSASFTPLRQHCLRFRQSQRTVLRPVEDARIFCRTPYQSQLLFAGSFDKEKGHLYLSPLPKRPASNRGWCRLGISRGKVGA